MNTEEKQELLDLQILEKKLKNSGVELNNVKRIRKNELDILYLYGVV